MIKKYLNYFITIISIIIYLLLIFYYQLDGNHLKELKYVYVLAIPSFMLLITSFLVKDKKERKQNLILYLIIYVVVLIGFVFSNARSSSGYINNNIRHYNYNFIPFKSIIELLNSPLGLKFGLYNIIGNFLMLTPLSVLLPLINEKFKDIKKYIITIFTLIIIIELMQFIFNIGSFDIDDCLLNFLGAIIFYIIIRKTKLIRLINKLFMQLTIDKKIGQITINIMYIILVLISLLFSIKNLYGISYDYQLKNAKADLSNLKCIEYEKTHITDYNNYHYYSDCNYGTSIIKVMDMNYDVENFIKSNYITEELEKKMNIRKEKIITNVNVKTNKEIGKVLIADTEYGNSYFYNIESMNITKDGIIYDYIGYLNDVKNKTNTVEIDINPLTEIAFVSKDNSYTIYKGKYYQMLICTIGDIYTGTNNSYTLPLDYEINSKSCDYLNNLK